MIHHLKDTVDIYEQISGTERLKKKTKSLLYSGVKSLRFLRSERTIESGGFASDTINTLLKNPVFVFEGSQDIEKGYIIEFEGIDYEVENIELLRGFSGIKQKRAVSTVRE